MGKVKKLLILTWASIILFGNMLNVQASSFKFNATAEKEQVNIGSTVRINMQVSEINAGEGINVVEANLEYDETVFESVTFEKENEWTTIYNAQKGARKGKFVAVKLVEGVVKEEKIGQIQLKLKDNAPERETEIKINKITSNNGTELIDEGNRVIKIKVTKVELNIDTDGDGKPDVNIDMDGDGNPDVNIDTDGDGKPDTNIDIDGDGKPDVNIDTDGDGKPDVNIDTDGDGKPDLNIDTDGDGEPDVNIDTTGDGKPNINVDTTGDGKPDLNIDTDGDGEPDVNIDTTGDGKPNINIDTTGDGKPDLNIDTDGDGEPDVNIDTTGDGKPDLNIDTDGDGNPDVNIDIDGDGKPDVNIRKDTDENQNNTQNKNQNAQYTQKNPIQYIQSDNGNTKLQTILRTIVTDDLKTGDGIVLIIIVAIVLVGINLVYFIVKGKQLKEEGKEKYRKRMVLSIIVSILLIIFIIFLGKDAVAFTQDNIEQMIEMLKSENDDNPESSEYLVTDKTISRIKLGTTVGMLESEIGEITVNTLKNNTLEKVPSKTETVKTGMVAEYRQNGRTYEISVLGDINGDGTLNQIELTRTIREYVKSQKWRIEKEIERLAADITCDGKIDEKDIDHMTNYIVYGEMQEGEGTAKVEAVKAPKIEMISGKEIAQGRNITNVTVKITTQNEKAKTAKTIYKITGSKTTEEKEINQEETIQLTEAGVYKITSYTYGINGNKSKGTNAIIVIQTPDIKISTEQLTNKNVRVTIGEAEGYKSQYKINEGEWKKYEGEFEVEQNCKITARFKDEDSNGITSEKEITNIDQEKPTGKIQVTKKGTSKISLAIEGQDATLSGIKEIRVYAKEKTATAYECKATYTYQENEQKNAKKQESLEIDKLKAATEYDMYIEVEDIAGNILNGNNLEPDSNTFITDTTEEMPVPTIVVPEQWTNQNIEVSIEGEEGYNTEYKINDGQWTTYIEKFEVENNCVIKARLIEQANSMNISREIVKVITKIDKLPPDPFTPTEEHTTCRVIVTANATDAIAANGSACSGIAGYRFRIDDENWTEYQTSGTYQWDGLTQGTNYTIKVEAKDYAGNTTTGTVNATTNLVPETDATFTCTPDLDKATNGDVTVEIAKHNKGYTLQYRTSKTGRSGEVATWTPYTGAIKLTRNQEVQARIVDDIGQHATTYITKTIDNIDKLNPKEFEVAATSTRKTITLSGSTEDTKDGTGDNTYSEKLTYYFSKDDGATWEPSEGQAESSYTFKGLESGTVYHLKMKAVDRAGNKVETNSINQVTKMNASDIQNSADKSSLYGATVTGYECESSEAVEEWKIFYADDNNIYLIAGKKIDHTYDPPSATQSIGSDLSLENVASDYPNGSQHITDPRIQALNSDYFAKGYTSKNPNMKAVAYMLDTEVWKGFKGKYADYAIGSSTIELLLKSYNEKYGTDYRAQAVSEVGGYKFSIDGGNTWINTTNITPMFKVDGFYCQGDSASSNTGIYLASPASGSESYVFSVSEWGNLAYRWIFGQMFRPVVCLNSDVQLEKQEDGTYRLLEYKFEVGDIVVDENREYTNNGTAIIPEGFSIVPGYDDVSQGLVISDVANDTENKGNQFVWVPVPDINDFHRIAGYRDRNTTAD